MSKVRCIDCLNCIDLRLSEKGDLLNYCKLSKIIEFKLTYHSLEKFYCYEYKEREFKANIKYLI